MSALRSKADILPHGFHVREVPVADIATPAMARANAGMTNNRSHLTHDPVSEIATLENTFNRTAAALGTARRAKEGLNSSLYLSPVTHPLWTKLVNHR
jgi:hypothetical protein